MTQYSINTVSLVKGQGVQPFCFLISLPIKQGGSLKCNDILEIFR